MEYFPSPITKKNSNNTSYTNNIQKMNILTNFCQSWEESYSSHRFFLQNDEESKRITIELLENKYLFQRYLHLENTCWHTGKLLELKKIKSATKALQTLCFCNFCQVLGMCL